MSNVWPNYKQKNRIAMRREAKKERKRAAQVDVVVGANTLDLKTKKNGCFAPRALSHANTLSLQFNKQNKITT